MTNEMLAKAKECKSAEEFLAFAKENGIEVTAEQAAENLSKLHGEGELDDDALSDASGGANMNPNMYFYVEFGNSACNSWKCFYCHKNVCECQYGKYVCGECEHYHVQKGSGTCVLLSAMLRKMY